MIPRKQFYQKNLNSLILEVFDSLTVNINEIYAAKILGVDLHKSCVVCDILLKSNDVGSTIKRVENMKVDVAPDLVHTAE
ncbi:hypothetical protein ISN45_Aa02g013140 [Arabidopsis thaliana x Arabidopsis arenosa]|uniref:Uncharacterized protein n=1 Tax=Arabidopsis thaliana x Arabidopsis arenosa TaxID=1240361 RepID=A0A8T2BFA9_9BRAS|nr:hypothetical protein ISN45_Aa02g013140 [Arabidopsis thaliana x Arabidopsis arenosa]